MGTGDYICVTLRGGAPWGFTLAEGEGDTYRPFLISQVEEGGRAFSAGVQEGDEVVSLNGEPCADLTLLRALALIDTSIDCLQLLLKRFGSITEDDESDTYCGERESSSDAVASTTLHILSPKHRCQSPRELHISESQDEAYYGELDSNTESPKGPQLLCTQLDAPPSDGQRGREPVFREKEGRRCFSPGNVVELQVSLSEQTSDRAGCSSLGSALGVEGGLSNREVIETIHTSTISRRLPCSVREPLGQHGVVLGSPSVLGQVEVILQQSSASGAGRGILSVGGPRVSGSVGSQSEGEEGGGHCEGDPGSFTVSFGIPTDEASQAAEQDSDSEGDPDKPNKHRARHSRLRRSESLSEKQVKEHKSKCKRIALLLTAAPPNPNNKGVLMFKKHRQRAKKYTLVSYGTGEDEPENSDDEDEEDDKQETHTVEFTLVAPNDSDLDKHFLTNVHSSKGVLTINWDKGLLEIERNLNNKAEMECLPDTKGKGALMFVQRRQRMDEIGAEHDELRRQGIPVEAVPESEKKTMEQSYMQSTTEGHAYMDVNVHQQSQQQHQCQQYQEQQFHEQQHGYQQQQQSYQQQQQSYQQQQHNYQQQQEYQQYQQQQYEQQHYQQQQVYQQQQEYHQEQQQMQQYSSNVNGTVQHQANEMQSSFSNRTAKPFSVEKMAATPFSPAMCGTNEDSVGQGEELASRDERIATPASRTGLLMDARKRNTGKQMFTFKEAPKVSPNPALLNLLNKGDKKLGFESGPEEDYLSLGAEACNFLQSPRAKQKNPPPVAPKPAIDPSSPPWSPQIEMNNQDMAQCAENSVSTPAAAPTTDTTPAPEQEPTPAPAPEPSPPPAPAEAAASTNTEEQHTWTPSEPESQKEPLQVTTQEENCQINSNPQPEPAPVTTWAPAQSQSRQESTNSWHPVQVQPQEPPPSQSPPQLPWVTRQNTQTQAQPPPPTNTWNPQIQPSWSQPQEPAQAQTHAQATWAQPPQQPQPHPQVQPPWAQPPEQPQPHPQVQPPWAQPLEPPQPQVQQPWAQPLEQPQPQPQAQPPWAQPLEQPQPQPQAQPPWAQPLEQPQPQPQVQPPWAQPLEQPQPQPQVQPQVQPPWAQPLEQPHIQQMQPTWGQPQEPVQQQTQAPWAKPLEADTQPQPPWMQPSQQKSQVQPPWVQQAQPESEPQSPWVQQQQKQAPQQAWPQAQAPGQSQPPWVSAQPQQQQQPSINAWPPSQAQAQAQPPWMQAAQAQPQAQPQAQLQAQPQANLNPWAPVPAQAQPQPSWPQQPPGHGQHSMNSWAQEQNQAQNQPHWAQPAPPQSTPQPNWQPATAKSPPQPSTNTAWPPAQTQPQTHWAPESQQTPVNVSTSMVNTLPSPKPWLPPQNAPQNRTPPSPPQRMHSFTISQRASSPINPMATILNPSSAGPASDMPVVRGKGADMFAKRQSRMEKYVVDSETVEANKASRSTSPTVSLPNEWKYSPNVRAPPSRAYNPMQSPSYPPAATKQLPQSSPASKDKKKAKGKPVPKLTVIDVMKHQPYQLDSSLFTFGPAVVAPKPPAPKPDSSPPNPPAENQPISYEQMAPIQPTGPLNAPYPQQAYGMPMQPMMHEGHYQQTPANVYANPNTYQQPPAGPYQQAYNPQYQQPAPPVYHPQAPQPSNPSYQQAPQVPYPPASSPPYMAAPSVPYQPQPPSSFVVPSFPVAARPESASGGYPVAAPKPRFTAKKSTAQALGRSYSFSPPSRTPFRGQKSASMTSSPRPPTRAFATPTARQGSWLEKGHKPLSPWEAASRHPLGLVDDAFSFRNLHQTLASNVRLAAQRKLLPEPPAEWKAGSSYQAPQKTGSQTWSQSRSQSRAPLPSFVSPAKSVVSTVAGPAGYRSLPRQWQPRRPVTEASLGPSASSFEYKRPLGTYKSVYTSNTWSWRR